MLASGFIACILSIQLLMLVSHMHTSSRGGKNDTTRRLAINMLRFAAISISLTNFNVATTAVYMPAATDFGLRLGRWSSCLSTGLDQDNIAAGGASKGLANLVNTDKSLAGSFATCRGIREYVPAAALLVSMSLAQSLPPMLFGFVFAIPAIKQLSAAVSARFSVAPSSSMAASKSG
jgi:hypothetical protein